MTDGAHLQLWKGTHYHYLSIVPFSILSSSILPIGSFISFLLPCYCIVTPSHPALYLPLILGGVFHSCSLPWLTFRFFTFCAHGLKSLSYSFRVASSCLTSWPPFPSHGFRPSVADTTGNGGCLHRQLILPLNPFSSFSLSLP